MEVFNLALLSRQAWRLLQNPETLSARILKAVYYPDCSILDASLGTHPSQIWRSIIDGRDILAQGIIKRIGKGDTTRIWSENWLPGSEFMKPITSLVALPPVLVSELISPATASWNQELVNSVFIPIDAEAILSIPLCTSAVDDFWAWGKDPKGVFSVRSCYKMIIHTKRTRENWLENDQGPLNEEENNNTWSTIWNIEVPGKLKNFVWRLAQDSIPTTSLLHRRHISTSKSYPFYGRDDTWRHALLECNMARGTWALAPDELLQKISVSFIPDPKEFIISMHETLSRDLFKRLVVTLWAVWLARRKSVHEDIFQASMATNVFIKSYMEELAVLEQPRKVKIPKPIRRKEWLAPIQEHVKINVDAAVTASYGSAGAVARDQDGKFLGASTVVVRGIVDPPTLEALAVR